MNDEYNMLREEIMFNMKQIHLYFAFFVTTVSTVLVYVFNNIDKPYSNSIFIAIFILLICATARVRKLLSSNLSISTYMEVFLEPYIDGRNWEIRSHYQVNGYSSGELDKRNFMINIMVFKTISVWFLFGVITYILYVILKFDKKYSIYFILNTILFLILMCITLPQKKNDRDRYIKHWKKVKEEEKRI